jgi:predicted Zn-dependent peptidase
MIFNVQKTVLANGLRVITAPQEGSPAITILVLVEAGSEYETKETNGISHFLEHLCFKGTRKRPKAIDIASELDGIGAFYNAFTGNEYTGYFAKADASHFDKIADVVSDIYLNSIFDPSEIDRERGVIIEEINMYEDLPMRRVHDIFTALLYGDQPAGWDIAGRKEVIQKLGRDDFIRYHQNYYLANTTAVAVAGAIDHQAAVEKVAHYFSALPIGPKIEKKAVKENQQEPQLALKFKDSDQTHLVLGVRGYNIFDERRYALNVLADILGGSMSSRLFQKIRAEMGAAYYVRAEADFYTDHGYLAASAGIDHRRVKEVIQAVINEFRRLKEEPLKEDELEKAKDHLIGNLMLSLETSDALAGFYGQDEILKREVRKPEEVAAKIRAVTADEVAAVAQDIFLDAKLNLAIIGPLKEEAELKSLLKIS